MRAVRYEILRNMEASGLKSIELPEKPVRVATIINEELFERLDNELVHNKTVFLEDQFHDWRWEGGRFAYFTRVAKVADVLIVYELDSAPSKRVPPYCSKCGLRTQGKEHDCKGPGNA